MSIFIVAGIIIFGLYVAVRLSDLQHQIDLLKGKAPQSPQSLPQQAYPVESSADRDVIAEQAIAALRRPSAPLPDVSGTPSFAPRAVNLAQTQPAQSSYESSRTMIQDEGEQSSFVQWLQQDVLVKIGALLLLMAGGWFVSYAFANNWIGPVGRISLSLCASVATLAFGVWWIARHRSQGSVFIVLGSTAVVMTLFAARQIYEFFTPTTALILMFLTVSLVAFVSVRYQLVNLALAGFLLGAIAPFLTNSPEPNVVELFLYVLVLVAGTLWVVRFLASESLTLLALATAFLYGAPYLDATLYEDKIIALLFAFVYTALFFTSNVTSMLTHRIAPGNSLPYVTAIFTGVYLVIWIAVAAPEVWQAPLYLFWMFVFALGSFLVYSYTQHHTPFYLYGGIAVSLLAAATAELFSGALLTIVFAVQLASLILVANSLLRHTMIARYLALMYFGLAALSIVHLEALFGSSAFTLADASALLVVMVSFVLSGASIALTEPEQSDSTSVSASAVLLVLALVYACLIIWLGLHELLPPGVAVMTSLIIYTVIGLLFVVRGRLTDHDSMKLLGSFILGAVVFRLLLIDVWNLEVTERIIAFFVVGVMLLSTAFIKKRSQ